MKNDDTFIVNQVAIRMVREPPVYVSEPLNSPNKVASFMHALLEDYDREVLAVINLTNDCRPINFNICSMGTIKACIASPKDMVKSVVLSNAAQVIICHNHPSGVVHPSQEDMNITNKIAMLFRLIDVDFLDHVIVGPGNSYYSFREGGDLPINRDVAIKEYFETFEPLKGREDSVLIAERGHYTESGRGMIRETRHER